MHENWNKKAIQKIEDLKQIELQYANWLTSASQTQHCNRSRKYSSDVKLTNEHGTVFYFQMLVETSIGKVTNSNII